MREAKLNLCAAVTSVISNLVVLSVGCAIIGVDYNKSVPFDDIHFILGFVLVGLQTMSTTSMIIQCVRAKRVAGRYEEFDTEMK